LQSRNILGEPVELLRLIFLTVTLITYCILLILYYTLSEKRRRKKDLCTERARFIEP